MGDNLSSNPFLCKIIPSNKSLYLFRFMVSLRSKFLSIGMFVVEGKVIKEWKGLAIDWRNVGY